MAERNLSPVQYGLYQPIDTIGDVTLELDNPQKPEWFALNFTLPGRPGADRGQVQVVFYNGVGEYLALANTEALCDFALDVPVRAVVECPWLTEGNAQWDTAPSLSRVEINSIYWGDSDWNTMDSAEWLSWSWTA